MTEFLLIRHAINDWVSTGRLAGWTAGVHLNAEGRIQAAALGEHLAQAHLDAIYASPLERTLETAQAVAAHHPTLTVQALEGIGEVHFGTWQGEKLSRLRREPLWQIVQMYPSRAQFPEGEAIRQAQLRAVDAIESLVNQHPKQRVILVSHSDVIKLIVAHYLGMHLDFFQRIEISPASLTTIYLGAARPTIGRVNDTGHLPLPRKSPTLSPAWPRVRTLTDALTAKSRRKR